MQGLKRLAYRHWVLAVICLMYFITYIDRTNISAAAPLIQPQ